MTARATQRKTHQGWEARNVYPFVKLCYIFCFFTEQYVWKYAGQDFLAFLEVVSLVSSRKGLAVGRLDTGPDSDCHLAFAFLWESLYLNGHFDPWTPSDKHLVWFCMNWWIGFVIWRDLEQCLAWFSGHFYKYPSFCLCIDSMMRESWKLDSISVPLPPVTWLEISFYWQVDMRGWANCLHLTSVGPHSPLSVTVSRGSGTLLRSGWPLLHPHSLRSLSSDFSSLSLFLEAHSGVTFLRRVIMTILGHSCVVANLSLNLTFAGISYLVSFLFFRVTRFFVFLFFLVLPHPGPTPKPGFQILL